GDADVKKRDYLLLSGDLDISPRNVDVWNWGLFRGKTPVRVAERASFQRLEDSGLQEVTRQYTEMDRWTYFDYKSMRFQKDEGMRIDFQMATKSLAEKVTGAGLDRKERAEKGTSDHLLLWADFDLPDFDSVR